MNVDFEFKIGQLKCDDCIYNDNCDTMWGQCVANSLRDCGVVHYVVCENKVNKNKNESLCQITDTVRIVGDENR